MDPETSTTASDALVYQGEALKVLGTYTKGDTEYARLGGYLVRFSGPSDPDLTGDYFTADTDFGTLTRKGSATLPAYYQHGFDEHFRNKAIGDADVTKDEFGVWAEYQIELRSAYERHLVDMAGKGLLGQSSGAVGHLVEHEAVTGGVYRIKTWPLGEASLTPTPAEPRTSAVPIKAFAAWAEQQTQTPPETPAPTKTLPPAPMADAPDNTPAVETAPAPAPVVGITAADLDAAMKALREDLKPAAPVAVQVPGAPALVKSLGDNEASAFKAWAMGDDGAMKHLAAGPNAIEIKASNNTDMNIGTAADGGNAVPTGHYQGIVARRDEAMLDVGVLDIPGKGLTVNVPLDGEADGEFIATNEAAANDRDAPALSTVAMTLVKYTKRVELSDELLQDEDSRLMAFLDDFVGRGMAKTHNALLVAEVLANGTQIKETASQTVVAAGELEDAVFGNDIAQYLSESSNWIMRPATYAKIASLTGNDRLYASQVQGTGLSLTPTLVGSPVRWSQAVPAYGTQANKFAAFGNFRYVGRRLDPAFTILRDPFSAVTTGQLRLHYYFRTVYKVLQAEAVGYIQHDAA
jgi:HK97 family phage major capsid protein